VYRADPGATGIRPAAPELPIVDIAPLGAAQPIQKSKSPKPDSSSSSSSFSPQQLSYGAVSLGIGVVMLPMVMTMIVVLLPVGWLFGTSERR